GVYRLRPPPRVLPRPALSPPTRKSRPVTADPPGRRAAALRRLGRPGHHPARHPPRRERRTPRVGPHHPALRRRRLFRHAGRRARHYLLLAVHPAVGPARRRAARGAANAAAPPLPL